uniref:nuclear transport factor 2 family protein n=1 Tax=Ningiella ruwaisensis TaxID=2364274 RepID=UPI00109EFC85|nr:nuclear transport factor 2 family protein [Ningiella ruwaisensis]
MNKRKRLKSLQTSCLIKVAAATSLLIASYATSYANANCLQEDAIRAVDAKYEKALLENDYAYLTNLLHPNFVWVHNHASYIEESREALLAPMRQRVAEGRPSHSVARTQEGVAVLIVENTAVLRGFTSVERHDTQTNDSGEKLKDVYHFMRTYILYDDKCTLLANQTMAIPIPRGNEQ